MSLKVTTLQNHLKTTSSPYYAHTQWSDTVEFADLIDVMAQGRTTLTKTDIVAAMELFVEELAKLLEDGKFVKTPVGSFYLCASGMFDSIDESFRPDGNGHDVRLHFRSDKTYESGLKRNAKIVRSEHVDRSTPVPVSAVSVQSETVMKAKAGDIIRISGNRLKFDPKDEDQGVFFVSEGGAEVRAGLYPNVTPSLVLSDVPVTVAAGSYSLAVRTKPNGKDSREGRADSPLVIEQ